MSSSKNVLCVVSQPQYEEYEEEFILLRQTGAELIFNDSANKALAMIDQLDPILVVVGMQVGPYEGIEFLSMILSRYPQFDKTVVMLPDKVDNMPPIIHSKTLDTSQSAVDGVDFDYIASLILAQLPNAAPKAPTPKAKAPTPKAPTPQAPTPEADIPEPKQSPVTSAEAPASMSESADWELPIDIDSPPAASFSLSMIIEKLKKPVVLAATSGVLVILLIIFLVSSGGPDHEKAVDDTASEVTDQQTPTDAAPAKDSIEEQKAPANEGDTQKNVADTNKSDSEEGQETAADDSDTEKDVPETNPSDVEPDPKTDQAIASTSNTVTPDNQSGSDDKTTEDVVASPPPAKEPTKPPVTTAEITLPISFDNGRGMPLIIAEGKLNQIIKQLKNQMNIRVLLIGHTSKVGDEKDNMGLGLFRAKMVMNLLAKKGIAKNRIETSSVGSSIPLENLAPSNAKNRRVTMRMLY